MRDSDRFSHTKCDQVCWAIKEVFLFQPKPWQVNVILNITVKKANTVVLASTNIRKSLLYQAILIVIPNAIVLVIIPTIALIKDQQHSLADQGIRAIALTAAAVKKDSTI